jgi:hypothetical protein
MDAFEKNMAGMRGEVLAANLLASAALQAVFMLAPDKKALHSAMTAFVEDTLNKSGPGKGDAHDEHNTLVRETARFMAMQALDHIGRMIQPTQGKAAGN